MEGENYRNVLCIVQPLGQNEFKGPLHAPAGEAGHGPAGERRAVRDAGQVLRVAAVAGQGRPGVPIRPRNGAEGAPLEGNAERQQFTGEVATDGPILRDAPGKDGSQFDIRPGGCVRTRQDEHAQVRDEGAVLLDPDVGRSHCDLADIEGCGRGGKTQGRNARPLAILRRRGDDVNGTRRLFTGATAKPRRYSPDGRVPA